jgi:hypothetical protein
MGVSAEARRRGFFCALVVDWAVALALGARYFETSDVSIVSKRTSIKEEKS